MDNLIQPEILLKPFAKDGDKNNIPLVNNNITNPQLADLTNGFPEITSLPPAQGGLPPERKDFNALGYLTTTYDYYAQAGGVFTFSQTICDAIGGYPLNARLWFTNSDGISMIVRSTVPNNTNNFITNPSYIGIVGENKPWVRDNFLGYVSQGNLFDCKWADHLLNDVSWLRADTFSWQPGSVYVSAYNHLVDDYTNGTIQSETISSYTILYRLAPDGHKITTDETNAINIFNATGVAWYYILDTTNTRFKLPRTQWGFVGLRNTVGSYVSESLPNISGIFGVNIPTSHGNTVSGAFRGVTLPTGNYSKSNVATGSGTTYGYSFSASLSSSTYLNNAPVQQRATQMYLYFYVGTFNQSAVEQTAGLNTELFNDKVDIDFGNVDRGRALGMTNCITEIPQDIKLELNDGTITLKAGSKVYVPNGFEQDGTTPKFDVKSISSDIIRTKSQSLYDVPTAMICLRGNANFIDFWLPGNYYSGATEPSSGTIWYDTSTNLIKRKDNGTWVSEGASFPLGLARVTTTDGFKELNQIFNGFGYIGSTAFALPGVKGLIPNGRNADGTLNNTNFTIDSVKIATRTWNISFQQTFTWFPGGYGDDVWFYRDFIVSTTPPSLVDYMLWYNPETNIIMYNDLETDTGWVEVQAIPLFVCGFDGTSRINGCVGLKTVFQTLDYNDKETLCRWSMPSDRYINLTLGASGTQYTAPSNGYFTWQINSTATNQYFGMQNILSYMQSFQWTPINGGGCHGFLPVKKGDVAKTFYTASNVVTFRFVYAEGEQ